MDVFKLIAKAVRTREELSKRGLVNPTVCCFVVTREEHEALKAQLNTEVEHLADLPIVVM